MNSEQEVGKRGPVHSNCSKVSEAGLTPPPLPPTDQAWERQLGLAGLEAHPLRAGAVCCPPWLLRSLVWENISGERKTPVCEPPQMCYCLVLWTLTPSLFVIPLVHL